MSGKPEGGVERALLVAETALAYLKDRAAACSTDLIGRITGGFTGTTQLLASDVETLALAVIALHDQVRAARASQLSQEDSAALAWAWGAIQFSRWVDAVGGPDACARAMAVIKRLRAEAGPFEADRLLAPGEGEKP